jgi:MFS family permease
MDNPADTKSSTIASLIFATILIIFGGMILSASEGYLATQAKDEADISLGMVGATFGVVLFIAGLWLSKVACQPLAWSLSKLSLIYLILFLLLAIMSIIFTGPGVARFSPLLLLATMFFRTVRRNEPTPATLVQGEERASSEISLTPKESRPSITARLVFFVLLSCLSLGGASIAFADNAYRFYTFITLILLGILIAGLIRERTLLKMWPTIKFGKD